MPSTPMSQRSTRASETELSPEASPFRDIEPAWRQFSFTLRRADDASLGMGVRDDGYCGLLITDVHWDGAIASWNNMCVGGPNAARVVCAGMRVVQVNDATDPDAMICELQTRKLLKFTIEACQQQGLALSSTWSQQQVRWQPMWPTACATPPGTWGH